MTPPNAAIVVNARGTSTVLFLAFDANDSRFFIRGRIDHRSDDLVFTIVTRVLSTGEKSSVRAEEFFDAMMDHFARQVGGRPTRIHAIWKDKDPELVTNLVRFNAALVAGDDKETAARKTFTGRMAAKYGYTTITFGWMDPQGHSGPFQEANVYFGK